MTNEEQISLLAWAAKQRGTTYGNVVAGLKPGEMDRIRRQREEWKKDRLQKQAEEWERKKAERPKVKKKRKSTGARTFDEKKALELYHQGLSDGDIARELGTKRKTTIHAWRKRRKLPANHKRGGAPVK